MELSEALRLGEYALAPAHGEWIVYEKGQPCAACPVGRACYTAGYIDFDYDRDDEHLSEFFDRTWPWTQQAVFDFPQMNEAHRRWFYPGLYNPVMTAISNLYECCGWSVSQIADWVETIEPQEDTVESTQQVKEQECPSTK